MDSATVVAVENSSPEVIHVVDVNSSASSSVSSSRVTPHILNLSAFSSNQHALQAIAINGGDLSFPVSLSSSQVNAKPDFSF